MAGKPEGMHWITPYLTVADAEAALDFYQRAFGFERGGTHTGEDGRIDHAEMRYQGMSAIMFSPEGDWSPDRTPTHMGITLPLNLYVYTPDVDALAEQARQAGAEVLSPPEDTFWGDRIARLKDPDGYLWVFAAQKS